MCILLERCHPVRIFARNIWEFEGKEDIPWKWTENQELVESINERLYGHMHMAHGFILVCVVELFKGANGCVDILISRCDPFLSFFSFVVKSEKKFHNVIFEVNRTWLSKIRCGSCCGLLDYSQTKRKFTANTSWWITKCLEWCYGYNSSHQISLKCDFCMLFT